MRKLPATLREGVKSSIKSVIRFGHRKTVITVVFFLVGALLKAEDLSTILDRMNADAPSMHGMAADLQMVTYTAVIDDKTIDTGTIKIKKAKDKSIRAVVDFSGQKDPSQSREIGFFGKIVRIYYPNGHYYQDYDLGKNGDVLSQYLLLGFGTSGDDLARSYTITPEDTEQISGVDTTKLLLVPKDPKALEHLAKAEIWIPKGGANPIQQQFYEANGNYRKVMYTDIHINPFLKGELEIKMAPNTKERDH